MGLSETARNELQFIARGSFLTGALDQDAVTELLNAGFVERRWGSAGILRLSELHITPAGRQALEEADG